MFRILMLLIIFIATPSFAAPITLVKQYLTSEISKNYNNDFNIQYARFTVGEKQYSLDNIIFSNLSGDYSISNLTIDGNKFSAILSGDVMILVDGRLVDYIKIPVLNHIINRGDIISDSDINWIKISTNRLSQSAIINIDNIIGKQASRRLNRNKPIMRRDIKKAIDINRGKIIAIIYENKFMKIKTTGTALSNGSIGEIVSFKNTQTGKIIQALIINQYEAKVNYL